MPCRPNPPHCFPKLIQVLCLSCLVLGSLRSALADDLVWDFDAVTPGAQDGAGTWTLGQPNWFNQTQTLDNQVWVDGDNAIFGAGTGAAGTVTLGGPVTAGDLTFNAAGSGSYTITGDTLTLGSGAVVVNSSATISSILAGINGLTKSGSGQLTLDGGDSNTISGVVTVSSGVLHLAKTGGATAVAGDLLLNGGDLTFGGSGQISATSAVSLTSASSVFNGTGVNAGAFAAVQTLASLTVAGGAFNAGFGGDWTITGSLSFTGGTPASSYVGNSSSRLSVGSLSLVDMNKAGAPSLSAADNSFTIYGNNAGTQTTVTVGAGGLYLENSNIHLKRGSAAGAKGSRLVLNGGVSTGGSAGSLIRLDGGELQGEAILELSGTAGAVNRTFAIAGGGADLEISVVVTDGASAAAGIIKDGAGTLTLSAANTYTGGTILQAGAVRAGDAGALSLGDITFTGGILQYTAQSSGTDWAARFRNSSSAVSLDTNGQSVSLADTVDGSNTGGLHKSGEGILVLSGTNTYAGATTIGGGVLQADNADALGAGDITFSGGTLRYTTASSTTDWAARFKNSTSAISLDTNGENVTLAGAIDGTNTGGLDKSGSGTLTLSGVNAFTGVATISAGTLQLGHQDALAGGTFAGGAGTLSFGVLTAATFGGLSGSTAVTLENDASAAVTLTIGDNNTDTTYSGVLSGAGSLVKSGSGIFTLSGGSANTNTGSISATAGRLILGKTAGVDAVAGDLNISGGAKVTFAANNQIADTAVVTMSGVSSVFNGTNPNVGTLANINETFAELRVTGGTFNSSAGSNWNIGTVIFDAGENRVFVGNSNSKQTYGSLRLVGMNGSSSSTAVTNGFTLFGNGGSFANRTLLTIGTGGLSLESSRIYLSGGTSGSELILNGDVATTGSGVSSIERVAGGALAPFISLSGTAGTVARTFDIASGADLTVAPVITNGAATSASIIKNGAGVLLLSGTEANTFTGGATVNAGTLRLNKTAGITAMNGDIVVNSGGTLQLSASHQIADTAGITLNGGTMASWSTDETVAFFTQNAGGLTSGGNVGHVTITGALTLAGGNTLVINSNPGSANPASWDVGSALLSGADILIGGSNGAGNPRTSLTIGAGGLTMLGRNLTMNVGDAGVILNLNGDFTGIGTNNINTNSSASVQPLLEIGGASRAFNVFGGTTTIGVIISGSGGSLVKTGNGLLQLTTASTYSGITTAAGGTFSVAGAGGMLTGTTAIIVNNGAVFQNGSSNTLNNDGVSNRINPAATLTLGGANGGGSFNLMSASTSTHTQDLDSLTLSGGANSVNVIAADTTTSTLTFTSANPYVRTAGTVDFTQNPATGGSIVFTHAPSGAGNVSNGLLTGATLNGTDLILAQSGVLTAFAGWIPTGTDTWTASGAMDVTGSNAVAYAATNIHALRFNTAGPFTVTLAGTHTVDADIILMTPNAGAGNAVVTGGVLQGSSGGDLSVSQFNAAGTLEIASTIADNTSATAFTKSGGGVLILSGSNTYTGITRVSEGVLRAADGTGMPAGSALLLNGGAFESTADTFSRSLGTAAGEVSVVGGVSGFSASGTAVTVNLGGAGATVQWGGTNFDPATLLLNAFSATAALDFANGLDLNGVTRSIRVDANTATISGVISNSAGTPVGFIKTGGGTLVLAQSNTFDGPATLSGGTLRLLEANAITGGVTVTSGTLAVGNDAALGTADLRLSGGGLAADGAARTLANNIVVTSTGTLTGSQTLTHNGVISGSGSLSKTSTSVAELAGDNSFTGSVTISGGILRVLSNTALGAAGGNITVNGSSHLELGDGVVISGETITVSSTSGTSGDGSPTTNRGGLQAGVNARAEWAGDVTLGVNQARIGVQEGGTLIISGNITDGANSFDMRLSGELTGTGGLILSGTGNAWDGQTEIVRGKVFLGVDNALPTTTVLDIHFTSSNNAEYAGLDMNGFNQTVGSLLNEGNTGNNAELTNSSRRLSTFTINETGTATYNGIITGNLALVKTGAGTTTLARSNSFSGGITVNDGVLRIANSGALAGGDVTVNGGAGAGGKLDLNNTSTTINSLNGAAGAVPAIIANESATAGTRTLTVGVNHGSGAFAGNIVDNTVAASGLVALTKIGTGTQTLSGDNSYTGTTTLSNGTVIADFTFAAPLNATSPILLQGGELIISGDAAPTIGAVTLVQSGSDFTTNILRIQDGATVTTSALIGQNFAPLLLDLTGGGTFVANSLTGITDTNGVLGQGSGQRASIYVQDDAGIGFGTQNGSNEIVRYTGATAANATNSSSSTNFIIAADLTRTAELQYNTLQIDTTAGDVTLDVGTNNLTVGTFGRGVLISGTHDTLITGTSGRFNGSSVFIANYSTGTTTVDVSLSGNAVVSTGPGLVVYNRTNNPNDLYVANGVFRVTGGDRDYAGGTLRIYGGGILELGTDINGAADGDFTRTAGLVSGNVAMIGNGGFSAQGADRVVALGGVAAPTALTWGTSGFLSGPGGDNNYAFKLGSAYSTHTLEFQNNIDLGSRQRIVEVADGVDGTNVDGRLTGVISGNGGGLVKTGAGTLELSGANTYTGGTKVLAGALQIASTGSTGTGKVEIASGAAVFGTGVIRGSDVVLANGATLYAGDGMLSSDHGTLNFTPSTGGGVLSLQGGVILDLTTANSVDATFGGNEIGSAGYISYVNDVSRSVGLGSGSHDLLVFNPAGDAKDYTLDFLTTGGTLQVLGSGGFTPEKGQVFNLLDWSGVTADFTGFDLGVNYRTGRDSDGNEGDFDLPDLFAAGLLWDVSQFTASGVIVVVPEPSRMLLLFAGFAMTALRRRR